MSKKRVLLVSEAHYLNSGFGTYAKQILRRLHATGKYEIAEFACYGHYSAVSETDWLYYGNEPDRPGPEEEQYNSNPGNHFGAWRFDRVCLDFKPDIVLCYRDPWMDMFIKDSPLRPYFHWVWMPTVDSAPQRQEWVSGFAECDALFAYSEFGVDVLKEQGKESVNIIGCASPGIDPAMYTPIADKKSHREELGLDPDCFIVGTVMRNQKRKLFFELMKAFRLFLDRAPADVAAKSYLYLHTSYPEKQGWNIPEGIMHNNLGGKVLSTYVCKNCQAFSCDLFRDALTRCKHCNNLSSVCPTVGHGLSIPDLIKVYNTFDLYAQYAICEGFGMPQVEAASCGVPVAATDYSAMSDVVRYTGGYPIKVKTFFRELETNAERAYPDNDDMADILVKFFTMSDSERMKKSMQAREGAAKRYNWDDTAKQWENYIDSYTPSGKQGQWDHPPELHPIPSEIPEGMDNFGFLQWAYNNVLRKPEKLHSQEGVNLLRDLNFGAQISLGVLEPIDPERAFGIFRNRAINNMTTEQVRANMIPVIPSKFVEEAHKRKKSNA